MTPRRPYSQWLVVDLQMLSFHGFPAVFNCQPLSNVISGQRCWSTSVLCRSIGQSLHQLAAACVSDTIISLVCLNIISDV